MRNLRKTITFISLMMFALNAPAEMNKCTDSNGKVTYTNLACPPGYELTNSIGDNSIAVEGNPSFTQQELDQMLAPIALYPDPLLAQMLMAATYPLEVVEAARWSNANPNLSGDVAVQAVSSQNWDPSIKSLVAFPQVLQTMDQNIEWTERLGDAFLGQQSQVMDTVQRLRQKAQQSGNLSSNPQVQVTQSDGDIDVTDANPDVAYMPYYDPNAIYGPWWWPDYPPVYWAPWDDYGWVAGFAWGVGIDIGANFFFGSWDWHDHGIYVRNPRYPGNGHPWKHDPGHRHGVPYRQASLNRQFGRTATPPSTHVQFREKEPAPRAAPPETRERIPSRSISQSYVEPRPQAFDNVGRGSEVRSFSARGNASLSGRSYAPPGRSSAPAPSRGSSNQRRF